MNIRELMEAVSGEDQSNPRSIAQREAMAAAMIARALVQEARRAPDFLRRSDRQRLERHLDELDMASKRIRESLKRWSS